MKWTRMELELSGWMLKTFIGYLYELLYQVISLH